jgi:hypothetical protein
MAANNTYIQYITQTGGPGWIVPLGRRDSRGASVQGSNNDIPAPNNTLPTIITKFKLQGLDIVDLVALLGTYVYLATSILHDYLLHDAAGALQKHLASSCHDPANTKITHIHN